MKPVYFSSWTLDTKVAKKEYHTLVRMHHPDVHPADARDTQTEIMKLINAEFERILAGALRNEKVNTDGVKDTDGAAMHMDDIAERISTLIESVVFIPGITIELVGCWVWIGGNTYDVRTLLQERGFKYSGAKKMWYAAPYAIKKRRGNYSIHAIRTMHGSTPVESKPITLGE